jgi:hypothetical protein
MPADPPYEPSPPTSHVYGWRGRADTADGVRGTSTLTVAFKDKRGGEGSRYEYYFDTVVGVEYYLTRLRAAAHPGHVVNELKRNGIRYRKVG